MFATAIAAVLVLGRSATAQVTVSYWTNSTSGAWGTALNWTNSTPPNGGATNCVLNFNATGTFTASNDFSSVPFLLNGLQFSKGTVTLAGNDLLFTNTGATLPWVTNSSGNTATINNNLTLGTNTIFGGANNITIAGSIGGSGALTKTSANTLTLTVSNSYSGATTLAAGVLRVAHAAALGATNTGTILPTGSTGRLELSNNVTVINETLAVGGRNDASIQLSNVSGTNEWTGTIDVLSGGINYNIESQAGTLLKLSGAITNSVTGGAARNFYFRGAGQTEVAGKIADGANTSVVWKTDSGTLTISGANNHSGGTILSNGTLNINNAVALGQPSKGTALFTITGGAIGNTSGGVITLAANNPQAWNGDFSFTGTNDLNLGAGTVALGGNRTVTVNQNTLTVSGAITGAYSLAKSGTGTLALAGSNTFTGATLVNAGTLAVNGQLMQSLVTVNPGGTLAGTGFIAQPATISNSATLSPGNSLGTLTFGNALTLAGTLNIDLDGTNGVADLLNVVGTLDIASGTVNFVTLSSWTSNAYVFATYSNLVGTSFLNYTGLDPSYHIEYHYNDLNQIAVVVPEPSALTLALLGLVGACLSRRRALAKR